MIDTHKLFSKAYRERQFGEVAFSVGRVVLTRQQFVENLKNTHLVAAKDLMKILKRLHVAQVRDILGVPMMDWARVRGMGEAKLRVLLDLLVYTDGIRAVEIDGWVKGAFKDGELRQWHAIIHQAQKKARKRGKHAV